MFLHWSRERNIGREWSENGKFGQLSQSARYRGYCQCLAKTWTPGLRVTVVVFTCSCGLYFKRRGYQYNILQLFATEAWWMEPLPWDSVGTGGFASRGEDAKSRVTVSDDDRRAWRVIPPPDVCLRLDSTQLSFPIRRLSESKQNKKNLDLTCCLLAFVEWQLIRPVYQAIKSRVCFLFSKVSCQRTQRQTAGEGWAERDHELRLHIWPSCVKTFQCTRTQQTVVRFEFPLSNFSFKILISLSATPQGQLCQHERASRESKSGCSECYPEDLTQIPPSPPCNNKGMLCW